MRLGGPDYGLHTGCGPAPAPDAGKGDPSGAAGVLSWPDDAPDGMAWQCPDCGAWATLGGNAGFHRDKMNHGQPELHPLPPPAESETARLRRLLAAANARAAELEGELAEARPVVALAEGMLTSSAKILSNNIELRGSLAAAEERERGLLVALAKAAEPL